MTILINFQVLPVVVRCLPLKEDFEENITVYKCLAQLNSSQNPEVIFFTLATQTMKIVEFGTSVDADEAANNELPYLEQYCMPDSV